MSDTPQGSADLAHRLQLLEARLARVLDTLDHVEQRLHAIEISGSPNLATRVGQVERDVDHILDPELGVYPRITRATDALRTWALVLLTALLLNLLGLLAHMIIERP